MKLKILLSFIVVLCSFALHAQEFNPKIDKDSLLIETLKRLPPELQDELKAEYAKADEKGKIGMLYWLNMPRSSKAELVANVQQKASQIKAVKDAFLPLVPKGYRVEVEFSRPEPLIITPETIDLKIDTPDGNSLSEWSMPYDSPQLKEMLALLKWDDTTLVRLNTLLNAAGCMSVSNRIYDGEGTGIKGVNIGYAYSGLGRYSYLLLDNPTKGKELERYNDGCRFIYHKENIVLEYGGGAAGPQCFEQE